MTTAVGARATWTRSTVIVDGVTYTKVRFVVRDGLSRVFDNNGTLLASGEIAEIDLDRRTASLTLTDGSTWQAEKARGCGCGGGN